MKTFCMMLILILTSAFNFTKAQAISSIGIIGDSSSTGAVTDPSLHVSLGTFAEKALFGLLMPTRDPGAKAKHIPNYSEFHLANREVLEAPIRIFNDSRKAEKDVAVMQQIGITNFNIEQYSFGYLLGRKLNVPPNSIALAGLDGTKIEHFSEQISRLENFPQYQYKYIDRIHYDYLNPTSKKVKVKASNDFYLPELVFVLFTANDLCRSQVLDMAEGEYYEFYKNRLSQQIRASVKNAKANPKGTKIIVVASLDVMQVMHKKEILEKTVPFDDGSVRCADIRLNQPDTYLIDSNFILKRSDFDNVFYKVEPKQVAIRAGKLNEFYGFVPKLCSSIFNTKSDDIERLDKLKSLWREQVAAQQDTVRDLESEMPKNIELHFVSETSKIQFTAQDVAADCFHPSISGNAKVAQAIYRSLVSQGLVDSF